MTGSVRKHFRLRNAPRVVLMLASCFVYVAAAAGQKNLVVITLLTAVSSICSIAQAQTSSASEPDYSHVNDFLDGRRTLLAINDLTIGGLVLPTSDGTKIDDKNIYAARL